MARGTTLIELLDQYRAECRLSLSAAHNIQDRDRQMMHIQRTQAWLWDDFDWPFLRAKRTLKIDAGQHFYSLPADIKADRVQLVECYYAGGYRKLRPGINSEDYSLYNPALDQRSWPPEKWQIAEDALQAGEQLEIWPKPSENGDPVTQEGVMTITGTRNLKPLAADGHTADLDDRLIILFCASEVLASRGDKEAASKLQMANKRYRSLRGAQMPRKKFTMFGVGQPEDNRRERIPIAVYRT